MGAQGQPKEQQEGPERYSVYSCEDGKHYINDAGMGTVEVGERFIGKCNSKADARRICKALNQQGITISKGCESLIMQLVLEVDEISTEVFPDLHAIADRVRAALQHTGEQP